MFSCMRTTIQIDDHTFAELKEIATDTDKTLSAVIQDCLRESLCRRQAMDRPAIDLPLYHGTGVRPSVDLNDSTSLLNFIDGNNSPA